ncbi:Protein F09C12.6 [Aphelenchoides avenae]|nr:Protein F09C12.6 [Aphelenchus avenae]
MYDSVLATHEIPIENSWTCAWKAFVGIRLMGSLIPPAVVLLISAERSLAVFCPVFYRNNVKRSNCKSVLSVLTYTAISVLTAFTIAYAYRDSPNPVPFYCGRKAAFSAAYSTYVYVADIAGYTIGLLFNSIALCGLYRHYAGREMRSDAQRQLQWLRNLLVISLVSTLTVAIPNMISLRSAWIGRVDIPFSAGAQWMSALKSSINFFVYLSFKPDFRDRVAEIFHGKLCVLESKSSGNMRGASGRSCDSKF